MSENSRFGDRYIYFCKMGLTCFSSLIIGQVDACASITAGPFLMIEPEDYLTNDLSEKFPLRGPVLERTVKMLERLPNITPLRVNALSKLLSKSVVFISKADQISTTHDFDIDQNQFSNCWGGRKSSGRLPEYPVVIEKKFLASIADSNKPRAQKLLNQLLGHILFLSGEDFDRIKSKTYELLVMISRAAIDAGASADKVLRLNHRFWSALKPVQNVDALCVLLTGLMNGYIDNIFDLSDKKDFDVIHRSLQYINENYSKKITLEDAAKEVYLSPTYFSKVFKKKMGCSFNVYLNHLRIEKCKQLLSEGSVVNMGVIGEMAGFEDQSYFTKVFKRVAGVSPKYFKKSLVEN
jgi:AraC-like DNA-binding protein